MLVLYTIAAVQICSVQSVVVLFFDHARVSLSQCFPFQWKHFVLFGLPVQGLQFCFQLHVAPTTLYIEAIYKHRPTHRPTHARTCLPKLYLQVLCMPVVRRCA